jgi:hypothetical protein
MKRAAIVTALLLATMLPAQAFSGNDRLVCLAKVINSEQLPFAPMGYWLVKVTLEVNPPGGPAYQVTVQDNMPWQGPPPRRGERFRVRCDPANPGEIHLI